jgi:outer membrane biosynthesis protein TonB
MAAAATKDTGFNIPPGMKTPLIVSGVFHLAVVVIALVGLPHFKSPPEPMSTAIPIEILPVADMTTTNRIPVKARPAPPKELKEKPIQKNKPPMPPKVEEVKPPSPKPKPPEKPKDKPKPKPVVPPPPTEKLKEPEPKPEEKPEEKPVEEDNSQQLESLLKNLQESDPVVEEDVPESKTAEPVAATPEAAFSETLTMSAIDALRQQLSRCWSIQAGARYAEDIVVAVRLIVGQDRRVVSATIVDQWKYSSDSFFRAAADSAIRAINSPQCEILNLPPDKYELWKDIIVDFNPKDML